MVFKLKNMDRFLLCENPLKDKYRPIYILQTIKHKMLMHLIPYDDLSELDYNLDDVFDLFEYDNPDGLTEKYMLKVIDFYDLTDDEIDDYMPEIRLHIKKAWKWYKSYLIFSDAQIDSEGNSENFTMN